jgi:hypothetical protein
MTEPPADPQERLEAAADELYGVPPEDFVPVRDELVGEAREAGDKEAAKAIGRLRRPTQAAWLSNLLARERGAQLDALLDLAEELAGAQRSLDGTQLRQLSAQRSKLVGAMAREARRIAAEDGHRVTESVEKDLRGILDAALADPDIADEVRSGRLTRTVSWSGFGPGGGETSFGGGVSRGTGTQEPRERRAPRAARRPAPGRPGHGLPGVEPRGPGRPLPDGGPEPEPPAAPPSGADEEDRRREVREEQERREREERERAQIAAAALVERARRDSSRAGDAHEDAEAALRDAESDREAAERRVEELTAELDRAREARAGAHTAVKDAARVEREAARAARDAAAALAEAETRLAELAP